MTDVRAVVVDHDSPERLVIRPVPFAPAYRDEVRRIGRHPTPTELPPDMPSEEASPLERAILEEAVAQYHEALQTLNARDRQLVVSRIEAQWTHDEIAREFGMPSPDAARMAVTRALNRLLEYLKKKRSRS